VSDLYDEDIVLWSERESELLRRLGAGERGVKKWWPTREGFVSTLTQ